MAANDIMASSLVWQVAECMAEHAQLGRPVPPDLCAELWGGLLEIAEHVMALEAIARSAGLLGPREFAGAIRRLPHDERQAIARAALARAEGNVVRLPRPAAAPPIHLSGCFVLRDQPPGGAA